MRAFAMQLLLVWAGAVTTGFGREVPAQPPGTDSLARERSEILTELARVYYWPERTSASSLQRCQVRFDSFCVSEHSTSLGIPQVKYRDSLRMSPADAAAAPPGVPDVIRALEAGASRPGDNGWFIGHLAFISANDGADDLDRSLQLVRRCRGNQVWCAALTGMVLHAHSRYAAADSAFASALRLMPAEERCRWRDIGRLLDERARRGYERLSCTEREAFEDRVWWLADPLYMASGNDRRTEHFSRMVVDSLLRGAPTVWHSDDQRSFWDGDISAMFMRYGASGHWIVPRPPPRYPARNVGRTQGRSGAWVHLHAPSYHFIPEGIAVQDTTLPLRRQFRLAIPLDSAAERYHPNYDFVADLTQVKLLAFPRGDSMLVAGVLDLEREPLSEAGPFNSALVLAVDQYSTPTILRVERVTRRATFKAIVPRREMLASVEVMSAGWLVAGRVRQPIAAVAPGRPAVSSPLLFSSPNSVPRSVDEALPAMTAGDSISLRAPLGVLWESYGTDRDSAVMLSVRLMRESPPQPEGLVRRTLNSLFAVSARDTLQVGWTELRHRSQGERSHAVNISLATLAPGEYTLEVETRTSEGHAVSRREIVLVDRLAARPLPLLRALEQPVPPEDNQSGAQVSFVRRRTAGGGGGE